MSQVKGKNILIFGTTVFSEVLAETISQDSPKINLQGFVLSDEYYTDEIFSGRKVYKYSTLKNYFSPDDTEILVSIGYQNMNRGREKIFAMLQNDGWKIASYVNPTAIIRTKNIGIGNIFLDSVNIGVKAEIGDGNIFCANSTLSHHSKAGNFNYFSGYTMLPGRVTVGNRCFFGVSSTINNYIEIADETFVGASCYVNRSTKVGEVCVAPQMISVKGYDSVKFQRFALKLNLPSKKISS